MIAQLSRRYKSCQRVSHFLQKTAQLFQRAISRGTKQPARMGGNTPGVKPVFSLVVTVFLFQAVAAYSVDDAMCGFMYKDCGVNNLTNAKYMMTHAFLNLLMMGYVLIHALYCNCNGIITKALAVLLFVMLSVNLSMAAYYLMELPEIIMDVNLFLFGSDGMHTGAIYYAFPILGILCLSRRLR